MIMAQEHGIVSLIRINIRRILVDNSNPWPARQIRNGAGVLFVLWYKQCWLTSILFFNNITTNIIAYVVIMGDQKSNWKQKREL